MWLHFSNMFKIKIQFKFKYSNQLSINCNNLFLALCTIAHICCYCACHDTIVRTVCLSILFTLRGKNITRCPIPCMWTHPWPITLILTLILNMYLLSITSCHGTGCMHDPFFIWYNPPLTTFQCAFWQEWIKMSVFVTACVSASVSMNLSWLCVAFSLWWPLRVAAVSRVTRLYSLKPMERIIPR